MKLKRIVAVGAILLSASTSAQANEDLVAKGEEIFLARCEYCHGDGPYRSATLTLARKYGNTETAATLADRIDLTPTLIETFVRNNTPSMAAIRKTEVTDEELGWLIAYLTRNNKE